VHLIDFGLAQHSATSEVLLESFGATPYFSAPELLCRKSHRGAPVDAYALGVILFCMVTNRLPYAANDIAELRRMAVQPAAVLFDDDNSPEVRALVLGLLQPDPARRLSLGDIMSSEFLLKHAHDAALSPCNAASSTSQTLPRAPSPSMLRHDEPLSMSAEAESNVMQ
jgi:serine/threonine protein kinase